MRPLVANNLTKKFGDLIAVDGINLEVKEGELLGLLGPNGAGKTTFISMLSTILKPTSGGAKICDYDIIKQSDKVRSCIGIVFQDPSLDDQLTGKENLEFHGRLYKVPKNVMRKRMDELLDMVELKDRAKDLVKTYSGGMRRRLEIARGLLHHPHVLFLDEPTLGLDPQTRRHIWEYILKLNRDERITMLLTTHYMDEADELCNRVAIIDKGKVVAMDTPTNLKDQMGGDVVTVKTEHKKDENLRNKLLTIQGVRDVKFAEKMLAITAIKGERVIPSILEVMGTLGFKAEFVTLREPTLEDVFLKYTGREMKDETEGAKAQLKRMMGSRRKMMGSHG